MKTMVLSTASYAFKAFLYGVVGATIMLLVIAVNFLNDKPELQVWHTVDLDQEFVADSDVATFAEYLALEDRLFQQLDESIDCVNVEDSSTSINRYTKRSLSDPSAWETNWNRTFELKRESPRCGVLLLHGLTDAPYSLRAIGERLSAEGAYVIGLRIPGHGTAPAALTQTSWQDMAAAVRIAMRHLRGKVGDQPLYMVGYSNGAALSVRYALESIEDPSLPKLDAMALLSPQIGITAMARFAVWQARVGDWLGLDKLQWQTVLPEYDPYKYASFPVNAGMQAYHLTLANRVHLSKLAAHGRLNSFPPVLACQSVVDSTVSTAALVRDLLIHLPERGHHLLLYDINRCVQIESLLISRKVPDIVQMQSHAHRLYTLTWVTNQSPTRAMVEARVYPPKVNEPEIVSLKLKWPRNVYSLSHIALPFREDDGLYGARFGDDPTRIHLGAVAIRGEKGVLAISAADMLRQRWNPFYDYQAARIVDHFKLNSRVVVD